MLTPEGDVEESANDENDLNKEQSDTDEGRLLSPKEYFELFQKLPLKALVPLCERMKPGGVVFTEDNIHLLPFGCNIIPYDDDKEMLNSELQVLKQDAGLQNATVSLELVGSGAPNKDAGSKCGLCNEQASSKCQNCRSVSYCCREHQLAHWKDHRPFCVLYEVVKDPIDGYSVVAKTNIKKGEAVLIEEPYFVTPFSTNEHFNLLNFRPVSDQNQNIEVGTYSVQEYETSVCKFPSVCVGCYTYLCQDDPDLFLCECGWPICNQACRKLANHRNWECGYLTDNGIVFQDCRKLAVLSPRIIGIVRSVLMKKRDPEQWNMLFDDTCEKLWAEKIQNDMSSRVNAEYILTVLHNVFRFEDLKYSELSNVLSVIEYKGMYGCYFEDNSDVCRRLTSIFHVASMIRHRCMGNVFTIQTSSGALHVIAAKTIKKGEPLYRNNDAQGDLQHVLHRQHFAMSTMNKFCDCPLCVDLSVGENSLSAIVCLKCKRRGYESYMMVETPTTLDSSWKCQKCGTKKSNLQVRNLLQDITRDLDYFEPNVTIEAYEHILKNCIAKYKGTVLHREHSVILTAEFDLIFYMMNRLPSLHQEETAHVLQLLNTRIHILKRLIPDAHSSIVSMKMRVATVLVLQAYRGHEAGSKEIVKTFEDLQFIHDDIAQLFVENTKTNALQAYLLICLRKMRKLISEVGELFNGKRRRLNESMKHHPVYKAVDDLTVTSSTEEISKAGVVDGDDRANNNE